MADGRIEIPLSEYNHLQAQKTELEMVINSISKENKIFKEKIETVKDIALNLEASTLSERLFKWGETVKPLLTELEINE